MLEIENLDQTVVLQSPILLVELFVQPCHVHVPSITSQDRQQVGEITIVGDERDIRIQFAKRVQRLLDGEIVCLLAAFAVNHNRLKAVCAQSSGEGQRRLAVRRDSHESQHPYLAVRVQSAEGEIEPLEIRPFPSRQFTSSVQSLNDAINVGEIVQNHQMLIPI